MPDLDTRIVTSADGTAVEYLSAGYGPHVIVVPGALAMAGDLTAFAALLARRHTVHVVQRRGRGGSGPQGDRYGIERECEDIEAVRARTGARLIFGHSFGGLVALRAACGSTAFDAVAVYEPGVSVSGSIPVDWTDRARREVAAGADFEAFITFVRGVNPDQTGTRAPLASPGDPAARDPPRRAAAEPGAHAAGDQRARARSGGSTAGSPTTARSPRPP